MIDRLQAFALFAIFLYCVHSCSATPTDAQACNDLCKSCNGIASFSDGRCECRVSDDDKEGTRCIQRMKRHAQELGLGLVSCDSATENRPARCVLGWKNHSKHDLERVARYFMKDGPITGSVFEGKKSDCNKPLAPTHEIVGITKPHTYFVRQPAQIIIQPKETQKVEPVEQSRSKSVDCDDSEEEASSESSDTTTPVPVVGASVNFGYGSLAPASYHSQPHITYSQVAPAPRFYLAANMQSQPVTGARTYPNSVMVNLNPPTYNQPIPVQMTYRNPQPQNNQIPLRFYSFYPKEAVASVQPVGMTLRQAATKTCTCPDNTLVTIESRNSRHADDCPEKKIVKKSVGTSTKKKPQGVKHILDILAAENKSTSKILEAGR